MADTTLKSWKVQSALDLEEALSEAALIARDDDELNGVVGFVFMGASKDVATASLIKRDLDGSFAYDMELE